MADRLDDLATATAGAWAIAGRAWMEAVNAIGVGWLDLANVESGQSGFNREAVVVGPQLIATDLHLGRFTNWAGEALPHDAISVEPSRIPAGKATTVNVRVEPPEGTASGTYTGSLSNAPNGACLVDGIGIYVVGDNLPQK